MEKHNRKTRQDKNKIKKLDKMQTNKRKTNYKIRQSTKQNKNKTNYNRKSKKRYITQQQKQ